MLVNRLLSDADITVAPDGSGLSFFFFRQQLLLPQQLVKMELVLASEGDGDGGLEEEKGAASLLGAPLKGRSISTNSRSVVFSKHLKR